MTSLHQIISEDASLQRRRKVQQLLLDSWWDESPESYMQLYSDNIAGRTLLARLEETYPNFYQRLINQNRRGIQKLYGLSPKDMQSPTSKFRFNR